MNHRRIAAACASAALFGLGYAVPAHADLFADNDARRAILELRAQVTALQKTEQQDNAKQAKEIQQIRGSLLDLSTQIDQVKTEIAQLQGQQDTTTRKLSDTISKIQAGQASLNQRLAPLEPVTVQIDGKSVTVQPAEKAAYEHALDAFRNSDFGGSATAFQGFLDQYPASAYAPDSRYWLANALFAQQKYRDATKVFEDLLSGNPENKHAPEAMLGLANAQVELRELRSARATLHKLVHKYPKSDAAHTARDRLAKLR